MKKFRLLAFALSAGVLTLVSCNKEDPDPEPEERALFLSYTIGSMNYNHVVGTDGFSNSVGKGSGFGDYQQTRMYEPTFSGESSLPDVSIRFYRDDCYSDSTVWDQMLTAGSYFYNDYNGISTTDTTLVEIRYEDGNDVEYRTEGNDPNFNIADHSFTITKNEVNDFSDNSRFYTAGNFSCVLYATSGSDSLVVTNGAFELRTINE